MDLNGAEGHRWAEGHVAGVGTGIPDQAAIVVRRGTAYLAEWVEEERPVLECVRTRLQSCAARQRDWIL